MKEKVGKDRNVQIVVNLQCLIVYAGTVGLGINNQNNSKGDKNYD